MITEKVKKLSNLSDTVKTIQLLYNTFKTSGMYAYIYCEEWLKRYWNGLMPL